MMRRILVLSIVSIAVLTTQGHAQGGSNYSIFGLGDLRRGVGALYDAMAGTSIAMQTDHGINTVNPALLGMTPYTRLQTGYHFKQNLNMQGGRNSYQNNGELDGVMSMFSVDTSLGIGINFGLLPYSSVNYSLSRPLSTTIEGQTISGHSLQIGDGGISAIILGASTKITDRLYVGASMQALFGTITQTDQVIVDAGGYYTSQSISSYDVRGLLFRGGIYWNVAQNIFIGAIIGGGGNASVEHTDRAVGVRPGELFFDSTMTYNKTSALPFTAGLGATWKNGRTQIGADLQFEDYSGLNVQQTPNAAYGTAFRATAAAAQSGAHHTNATFGERVGYSAGVGYQQMYYKVQGSTLAEYFVSGGFNFPLGGAAMVDAAATLGIRTPMGGSGQQNVFGRLSVAFSIGEIWFRPFARE